MEIYHQLPEELQKIIKYFALECPYKEELKNYDKAIYTQSITSYGMYYPYFFERLFVERPNKINNFIVETAVDFYNSYDKTIKYNYLHYMTDLFYERNVKGVLYHTLKSCTSINQRKVLANIVSNNTKPFSKLNKNELMSALITKYKNGTLSGKNTFNDPKDYDGFSVASDDSDELKEPIIKKFKTQEEAKKYYNNDLKEKFKGRGPNIRKPDENGFYLSTIGKGDNKTKIRTTKEIYDVRKWSLTEKTGRNFYTFFPCYEDITDKSTLQWWFIHY